MSSTTAARQDARSQETPFSTIGTGYHCEIVTDRAGLDRLRHEWDVLRPPQLSAPWLTSHWADACASAFNRTESLRIFTLRRRGTLVAIAPMAVRRSRQPLCPLRLDFLGAEELREPNGLIYVDDQSLADIADSIAAEPTLPVRLSRVPADPRVVSRLTGAFRRRGWVVRLMHMPYPYVDLRPGSSPLKKSLREDLRRARRKAEHCADVASEIVQLDSVTDLDRYIQAAFEIEASGWKGVNNTAILCNTTRNVFFTRLASSCVRERTLRLAFLRVGDRYAAAQFAVESDGQYWLLNVGYREDVRQFSPGNLLLEETIRNATEKGLTRYNFLGKVEDWTKRWTSDLQDCIVLAAYRPNLLGARAGLSDALYLLDKRRRDRAVQTLKSSTKARGDGGGRPRAAP